MKYCNGAIVHGPKIGDRLMRKLELGHDNIPESIPCTVVYVNEAHGYYTVLFDSGYREAYQFGG